MEYHADMTLQQYIANNTARYMADSEQFSFEIHEHIKAMIRSILPAIITEGMFQVYVDSLQFPQMIGVFHALSEGATTILSVQLMGYIEDKLTNPCIYMAAV